MVFFVELNHPQTFHRNPSPAYIHLHHRTSAFNAHGILYFYGVGFRTFSLFFEFQQSLLPHTRGIDNYIFSTRYIVIIITMTSCKIAHQTVYITVYARYALEIVKICAHMLRAQVCAFLILFTFKNYGKKYNFHMKNNRDHSVIN